MDWDKFFFSDVGKKIKAIIRGCFYVETILILIAGCLMELYAIWWLFSGEVSGFLMMLLIPIAAALAIGLLWLSVLLTYGFAEIVDTAIAMRTQEQKKPVAQTAKAVTSTEAPSKVEAFIAQRKADASAPDANDNPPEQLEPEVDITP